MRFNFFEKLAFDIELKAVPNGPPEVHGIFTHFLEHTEDPHATLFGAPNPATAKKAGGPYLTPHMSGGGDQAPKKKLRLAELTPEDFAAPFLALGAEAVSHFPTTLRPVDFDALEREGFRLYCLHGEALRRWVRLVSSINEVVVNEKPTRQVKLTPSSVKSFAKHVLRRPVSFEEATTAKLDMFVRLLAVRVQEDGTLGVRVLAYYPGGYPICGDDVETGTLAEPGWYEQAQILDGRDAFQRHFPIDALKTKFTEINAFVSNYPKVSGSRHEEDDVELTAEEKGYFKIAAAYAGEMIHVIVSVDVEALSASTSPAGG